jgi:predicted alternative tryptophan synthase beta-subunit
MMTADAVATQILAAARQHPVWNARKLKHLLETPGQTHYKSPKSGSKKLATGLQAYRSNVFWKGFLSPPKTVA